MLNDIMEMSEKHIVGSFIGQVTQSLQQINSEKEKEREKEAVGRAAEGGRAKRWNRTYEWKETQKIYQLNARCETYLDFVSNKLSKI